MEGGIILHLHLGELWDAGGYSWELISFSTWVPVHGPKGRTWVLLVGVQALRNQGTSLGTRSPAGTTQTNPAVVPGQRSSVSPRPWVSLGGGDSFIPKELGF